MNSLFRKKPIVIEAFQMTKEARSPDADWPKWLTDSLLKDPGSTGSLFLGENESLLIGTLEGYLSVSTNDWIIKGVHGEIYPCKPDIFDLTYEKV